MKGIFCLEGLWDCDLKKKSSTRPILDLLSINTETPYIHKDCATNEELEYYLDTWVQEEYSGYPILYLAFHGAEAEISSGNCTYNLEQLADKLKNKCQKKLIMFGSCSVLNIDKRYLKNFLERTKAFAICGYKIDVNWMTSTAFELLLLHTLQENVFDKRGLPAIIEKTQTLSKSFKELNFRLVTIADLKD